MGRKPLLEESPVVAVLNKWSGMTTIAEFANVRITGGELLGFADVFPRLYQVEPKEIRIRFEAWRDRNQIMAQEWNDDLDGFFNSEAADSAAGIVPSKPSDYQRAADAMDLARQQDAQRPLWLPPPPLYARRRPVPATPDLGADQGSQVSKAVAGGGSRRHLRSQPLPVIDSNDDWGEGKTDEESEGNSDTGLKVRLV
jgi:hypothetical protein